jgi:serine/threonine protein kinase
MYKLLTSIGCSLACCRDYYDEKVDIWQVGCMVHELLCGSMPFEVGGLLAILGY